MNKSILIILISFSLNIHSKPPIYVSLGSNCVPAFRLNDNSLRLAAYPFDWLIASFSATYSAIKEDFAHFFTELTLNENGSGVIDAYGLEFLHDWRIASHPDVDLQTVDWVPNNIIVDTWQDMVPEILIKYQRRINRFRSVCNSNEKVCFIRAESITKEESILLRDLIIHQYPNLGFILVVVSKNTAFETPWNLDKLKNFYIEPNDLQQWTTMLKQLEQESDLY
jgi:hypothetical protein